MVGVIVIFLVFVLVLIGICVGGEVVGWVFYF